MEIGWCRTFWGFQNFFQNENPLRIDWVIQEKLNESLYMFYKRVGAKLLHIGMSKWLPISFSSITQSIFNGFSFRKKLWNPQNLLYPAEITGCLLEHGPLLGRLRYIYFLTILKCTCSSHSATFLPFIQKGVFKNDLN